MGMSWEMRVEVCDVLRSLVFILKAVKQAKDISSTFLKICCDSYVGGEGVRPHRELKYFNPRRNEGRQSQRG